MNEFRAALEDYLTGRADPSAAQARIVLAVQRTPALAAAMMATIEAYQRANRFSAEVGASLKAVVQSAAASAPVAPVPVPSAADPSSPAPDRTQFRPAGRAAAADPQAPAADRTQFRPKGSGAAPAGPAAAPPAPADRTTFKPRSAADTPSPPAPADPVHAPSTSSSISQVGARTGGMSTTGGTSPGSWTDYGQGGAAPGEALSVGSVLAGRYVLESIVAGGDKGGMGVVYKALDLPQQEAQERNPYVAIKVLNEEFKRHPDSIKALVRETNKTRKLSHPNIVSVYDFNRDRGNVYMAMELLEGSPLNDLIRSYRDRGGMPVPEALKIVRGLASGLAHAHANRIVHSDFKPGNSFLTHDGRVKVLDFGIARAAKVGGASGGDKTLFDAGSLGALTMPYASCEQIEGQEPDAADDVYALGIVAYELLTGKHPYERLNPERQGQLEKTDAVTARDKKLKPAPIAGLARSQWLTLQKALAFDRDHRPRNAGEFLEGLAPKKKPLVALVSAGAAVVVVIVVLALVLPSYLERSRLQTISQELQSDNNADVAQGLVSLRKYSSEQRTQVLINDAVQSHLFAYFNRQVRAAFDPAAGRYGYQAAVAVLKDAQSLSKAYADSRQLTDSLDQLESARKAEVLRLAEHFEALLRDGTLIARQNPDNVQRTLGIIAQLDPTHSALNDKRLPIAFATQTRVALDAGNSTLAGELLAGGLRLAPKDPGLLDLQDRVDRLKSAAQLVERIGGMEKQIAPLASPAARIEDFRSQREVLTQLRSAAPSSAALGAAQSRLEQLVSASVQTAVQQGQMSGVEALLGEFTDLLPDSFVATQRSSIARVVGEAQARQTTITQLRATLAKDAGAPAADDTWVAQFERDRQNLENLVGKGDSSVREAQDRVAQAFLTQARKLRQDQRLSEAQRLLALAQRVGLAADLATAESNALAQARAAMESDARAREAQAQLAAARQRVLDQARADHIDVAESLMADLQKRLPATDPFLLSDGPRAIGNAYLVRAQRLASQSHFDDALQMAQSAQRAAPRLPEFQTSVALYQTARTLSASLATADEVSPLRPAVERLRNADRNAFAPIEVGLVRILSDRLNRVGARDPAAAMQLRASVVPLFPGSNLPTFTAKRESPPAVAQATRSSSPAAQAAKPVTAATPAETPAAPAVVQQNLPAAAPTATPTASAPVPIPTTTTGAAATPTMATVPALRPCTASLAGLGQNPRASCRDALSGGGRGPELVVIAPGAGLGMFAIMRNETSVAEYAAYCAANNCAAPSGATAEVPITTVPVSAAEKYAAWLSAATGAKYRLPTEAEWHRAAGAALDAKANCLVSINGQNVRGTALRPADQGDLNPQGLRHALGNAQEWVRTEGGGLKAMGGAIGDAIEICTPDLARVHNGAPDGKTGFRLVRELH
ncbi:MAG TPA: protein kinase [Steroidobacteraceae bacterium]|nr:protein kinase [Steroidobacteraceae bacterium]